MTDNHMQNSYYSDYANNSNSYNDHDISYDYNNCNNDYDDNHCDMIMILI